jgi:hypothetical protein
MLGFMTITNTTSFFVNQSYDSLSFAPMFSMLLQESVKEDTPQFSDAIPEVNYKDEKTFSVELNDPNSCTNKLKKAGEMIFSCPSAYALWNDIGSQGSFKVSCISKKVLPTGTVLMAGTREILVSETLSTNRMFESLLFDLYNLKKAKELSEFSETKCSLNHEDFVKKNYEKQYSSLKMANELLSQCVDNVANPAFLHRRYFEKQVPGTDWSTFSGFSSHMEKIGFGEHYRRTWFEACAPDKLKDWTNVESIQDILKKLFDKENQEIDNDLK